MKEKICLNIPACSKTGRNELSIEFSFIGNGVPRNGNPETSNQDPLFLPCIAVMYISHDTSPVSLFVCSFLLVFSCILLYLICVYGMHRVFFIFFLLLSASFLFQWIPLEEIKNIIDMSMVLNVPLRKLKNKNVLRFILDFSHAITFD
jgi:hypothetical protein